MNMKNLQCLKDQEGRKSNIYLLESEKDFSYISLQIIMTHSITRTTNLK